MRTSQRRKSLICICCLTCGVALFLLHAETLLASPRNQEPKGKVNEVSSDQSLWRVDLHAMGYINYADENTWLQRGQFLRGQQGIRSLDFVGDGAEVASFVTQEPASSLTKSDPPNSAPLFRLHAIFLDAASGKVLKALDWPLRNPDAGIFPRSDGSFIFFSTDRLILYSKEWKPVKDLSLLRFWHRNTELREIMGSPSGKMLMLYL